MDTRSGIERFYDENVKEEWDRLDEHRTEIAITLRVFRDFFPGVPANVADIGGGPGRYSIELARQGYDVTLVDVSFNCLAFARGEAERAGVSLTGIVHANALDLSAFGNSVFDVVLLMGPMYHLLAEDDRYKAMGEAKRIVKPGGLIFTSFISRFAPFRWSSRFDPGWYTKRKEYCQRVLETGIHDQGSRFPHAYFAHPAEIRPFMEKCELKTLSVVGCEGAASMGEDGVNALEGADWEAWVDLNYEIGKDPHSHGAAEHILHVGQKSV